jgi:hypothetical protein
MRNIRTALLAGSASVLLLIPAPAIVSGATAARPSDFDGDGIADLAIGVPGESVGGAFFAGAVNVLYGRPGGLTATGDQLWTQDSPGVPGASEGEDDPDIGFGDHFGSAVASGDFDSDSYADLAIAVPDEGLGLLDSAGAVTVLYGGPAGLSASRSQLLTQSGLGATAEEEAGFGRALAAGDFNRDGYVDLAIAAGGATQGSAQIVYGGPSGLTAAGSHQITAATPGIPTDPNPGAGFGRGLATGDLDGDGYGDLAIGVPNETVSGFESAGVVVVIEGGPSGLDGAPGALWSQDTPGVLDAAERGESFGSPLATGDFDGDAVDDLAIGVDERVGGAVSVLSGSVDGLTADGNQFWHQDVAGVPGRAEDGDGFGLALAAADLDGDGRDDLAIGFPSEVVGSSGESEGAVITLPGGAAGLTSTGSRLWTQDTPGVHGRPESFDAFGSSLAAANYGRSGQADLAVGVPFEEVSRDAIGAGFVNVLYGGTGGLSASGSQGWSQDVAGVKGKGSAGEDGADQFGSSLSP